MLFSVDYHSKRKQQADEIRGPIMKIIEIAHKYPEKRYNIIIGPDCKPSMIDELIKPNLRDYTISCSTISLTIELINRGYNAYFNHPVTDWEAFSDLRRLKVTDVLIDGPLGFQMSKIEKLKHDCKIRVTPCRITSIFPSVTSFYIRPEDLGLYSPIDIIELSGENQDILFAAYNKEFIGYSVNDIIKGLPAAKILPKEFGQNRLNCGQVCRAARRCNLCGNSFELINKLRDIN